MTLLFLECAACLSTNTKVYFHRLKLACNNLTKIEENTNIVHKFVQNLIDMVVREENLEEVKKEEVLNLP